MRDYDSAYRDFSLKSLEQEVLQGSLVEGLNACVECCDRWADGSLIALHWVRRDFTRETLTFIELQQAAGRFANLLHSCNIGPGDIVAGLLPRIPELLVVVLARIARWWRRSTAARSRRMPGRCC
jgi:acetyl-CoA synthetase